MNTHIFTCIHYKHTNTHIVTEYHKDEMGVEGTSSAAERGNNNAIKHFTSCVMGGGADTSDLQSHHKI
jgi:hypothetical protein